MLIFGINGQKIYIIVKIILFGAAMRDSTQFSRKKLRNPQVSSSPKFSISPWSRKQDSSEIKDLSIPESSFSFSQALQTLNEDLSINDFVNTLPEVKTYRKQARLKQIKNNEPIKQKQILNLPQTTRPKSFRKRKAESQNVSRQLLSNIKKSQSILMSLDKKQKQVKQQKQRQEKVIIKKSIMNPLCEITKNVEYETQELLNAIRSANIKKKATEKSLQLGQINVNPEESKQVLRSLDLKRFSSKPMKQQNKCKQLRSNPENQENIKTCEQKLSGGETKKIKERSSSKLAIQNLLIKRNSTLTKTSQKSINWCAAMEASNALNMIDLRNTREAPLAVGTGKQRSTVQRMIALRSLLG